MTDPYEHGFEVAQRRRLDLPPEPTKEERKRWQRPGRVGWQVIVFALGVDDLERHVAIVQNVTREVDGAHAAAAQFALDAVSLRQ